MQTLNQAQFAKLINVDRSYVTELKQAGRLVFAENGKVDVEASQLLIAETADPNRDDVKTRHQAERAQHEKSTKEKLPKTIQEPSQLKFSEGRATEQHYKALQAELEYKKTIGELVPKADMRMAIEDVVTTFRQKLENLPHSLAADLVGKDLDFIRATLKQQFHNVLTDLSRDFNEKITHKEAESQ